MATRSNRGFTLIELLIIICLIGIVAALTIPPFMRKLAVDYSKNALKEIHVAELNYMREHGAYTNSIDSLTLPDELTAKIVDVEKGVTFSISLTSQQGPGFMVEAFNGKRGIRLRIDETGDIITMDY